MNGFDRTLMAIGADASGARLRSIAAGAAALLLCAWLFWMLFARVEMYVVSKQARLEVDEAAFSVDAPSDGVLKQNRLVLGALVRPGDVLIELDAREFELSLAEARAELESVRRTRSARERELEAQATVLHSISRAAAAALDVADARRARAAAVAEIGVQQDDRVRSLARDALASQAEVDASMLTRESQLLEARALDRDVQRVRWEEQVRVAECAVKMAELRRQIAEALGQIDVLEASVARLEHEVNRRRVRASTAGTVAEAARTRAGSVVAEGQRLGMIVPLGELRIVAEFSPADAIGRVRPDQAAVLRLDGFPWAHYGVASGAVLRVATEPRDGFVRVDVAVHSVPSVPLQHGLTGSLEVSTGRVTPFSLLLRTLGGRLSEAQSSDAS